MPRIVHFELPAEDPDRAVSFYEGVFGWQISKWDGPEPYWLVNTGEGEMGINGGIMKRKDPNQPPTNVIDVPDIDDYVARITAAGGQVVVPKMEVPEVGYLAYFKDTEGNILGVMQMFANA